MSIYQTLRKQIDFIGHDERTSEEEKTHRLGTLTTQILSVDKDALGWIGVRDLGQACAVLSDWFERLGAPRNAQITGMLAQYYESFGSRLPQDACHPL